MKDVQGTRVGGVDMRIGSRTEEAHIELPIREANLNKRACYGWLSRSCKIVQLMHALAPFTLHPMYMLVNMNRLSWNSTHDDGATLIMDVLFILVIEKLFSFLDVP